jgi:hypothetical protein
MEDRGPRAIQNIIYKKYHLTASIFRVIKMLSKQPASGHNDQIIAQRQATLSEVFSGFL